MCVSQQKWIIVGLWVLAACAGRSTRSKGSRQTLRLSHPVRVARKPAKTDFSGFRAGDRAGLPRTCPEFAGAGNLAGSPPRTGQKALGPWNVPGWGPSCQKSVFWVLFVEIGGVAPVAPAQEARVPGFCQPGAPDGPVPGFCQPGTPDPPGGYPPHPQKCQNCVFWPVFEKNWQGRPSDRPRKPRVLESASLNPQTPPGGTPQTGQTKKHLNGRGFGVLLYCLTARGQ